MCITMNSQSEIAKIDLEQILAAGQERRQNLLALPKVLETAYRQQQQQNLVTFRRVCLLLGLVLIAVIDLGEMYLYGSAWNQMLGYTYAMYALLLLVFVPLVASKVFERWQDLILTALGSLLMLGTVLVLWRGMPVITILYGNVLLLLFVYMVAMLRLGLYYALWVLLAVLVGFNLLIVGFAPQAFIIVFNYNVFFLLLSAAVFYAIYCFELAARVQFLQKLVILREREHIHDIKIKLRTMASVDSLTGVMNNQEMQKSLNSEWRRLCRSDADLSLVMIGVDDFRAYNGCFGHKAGDEVLIKIARCIGDTFKRASDVVARVEGEIFMVIMPETGQGEAELMARTLLKRIGELNIDHPQSTVAGNITVSMGVASCRPDIKGDHAELSQRVKQAFDNAKDQGKARYILAD